MVEVQRFLAQQSGKWGPSRRAHRENCRFVDLENGGIAPGRA